MENENGIVIRNALEEIGRPATLKEISEHIADETDFPTKELLPTVKRTLKGGVQLGFLQCQNGQYYNTIERNEYSYLNIPVIKVEKPKPVRGLVGRPPKGRVKATRRRKTAKPRANTRRTRASPRILARGVNVKVKYNLNGPKKGNRAKGRPAAQNGTTRGSKRKAATQRGIRGPGVTRCVRGQIPMLVLPRFTKTPKRQIRKPTLPKFKTGARRRKAVMSGRPYKANVRGGNRGKR